MLTVGLFLTLFFADSNPNLDLSLAIAPPPPAHTDGFHVQPGWINMPVDGRLAVMWRYIVETSCSIEFFNLPLKYLILTISLAPLDCVSICQFLVCMYLNLSPKSHPISSFLRFFQHSASRSVSFQPSHVFSIASEHPSVWNGTNFFHISKVIFTLWLPIALISLCFLSQDVSFSFLFAGKSNGEKYGN